MKSLVVPPFVAFIFLFSAAVPTAAIAETTAVPKSAASVASYGQLPLGFEANQGQADPSIEFVAHGPGYTLLLKQNEAIFTFHNARAGKTDSGTEPKSFPKVESPSTLETSLLHVQLIGAHPNPLATREGLQITRTNYFLGNDPARWRTNIANYDKVRYHSIYDGIDLVYYGNQGQLEHDFVVAPGADPARITLAFNFANPDQETLRLDPASGKLLISANAELRLLKPVTYQESNGKRVTIPSRYKLLAGNRISFAIGRYNHAQPLIIDPVLVYSTYLGGSGSSTNGDRGNGIAVDSAGNAYVVGTTPSTDFPITSGAFQSKNLSAQPGYFGTVFVSKLNPTGTALIYSTYLGGSGPGGDFGYGIALDAANNAFVTGATFSYDFPMTCGAFQTTRLATSSTATVGFVAKLSSAGDRLMYSTYLGGTGPPGGDEVVAQAIAVNPVGNAYVTGYTYANFPVTADAFQTSIRGLYNPNGFVTKLNLAGTALEYSTYLGGSSSYGDYANAIAIDASGDAFITGVTHASDFPVTQGAFQATATQGINDGEAFVTELDPTGSSEVYSTYLGGSYGDTGQAIAVDSKGFAYVAGNTSSTDFPTTSGVLESSSLGMSFPVGFVTKLNLDGTDLVYSTYLQGQQTSIMGLAVDSSGTAYVAGTAPPQNSGLYGAFQVTPDALSLPAGSTAAFLVKLDPAASVLNYATLIGGSGTDGATSIALDASGSAYVTGYSNSGDFPVSVPSFQGVNHNVLGGNAFVTKFALAQELNQTAYPVFAGPISTTFSAYVEITNVQCSASPTFLGTYDTCAEWDLAANASGPTLEGTVNYVDQFGQPSLIQGPFAAYPSYSSGITCYNLNPIVFSGPIGVAVSGSYSGDANYQPSSGSASATDPGCPPFTGVGTLQAVSQRPTGSVLKSNVNLGTVLTSSKVPLQNIGPKFLPPRVQGRQGGGLSTDVSAIQSQASTACIPVLPTLTVTLKNSVRYYGAANPRLTYTIAGLLDGDTVSVLPSTVATVVSPVGSYPITATVTGTDLSHYTLAIQAATLSVEKAILHIRAHTVRTTYGEAPPALTAYSLIGFVNGDADSVVSGAPLLTTTVTAKTPVGFYPIDVQVGTLTAANYSFVPALERMGVVDVRKARLKAIADDLSMIKGSTVPALTYTLTGFVNGDTASTAVTGTPILFTRATSRSKPGKYIIRIERGTLAAHNYAVATVHGVLTVLR